MNHPKHWRRGKAGPWLRRFPRIKHLRGTFLHRTFGERLFGVEMWQPERNRFAAGVAVGVFFAMIPLPLQMIAAGVIAVLTRVNVPAAIMSTWVSNPITTPLFLYLQYELGSFLLGKAGHAMPDGGILDILSKAPIPILVGAGVMACVGAILAYPLAVWGWDLVAPRLMAPRKQVHKTPVK
jgi:uncharacterized protein (DUF2062 family)